jgi:hypothetical protein
VTLYFAEISDPSIVELGSLSESPDFDLGSVLVVADLLDLP